LDDFYRRKDIMLIDSTREEALEEAHAIYEGFLGNLLWNPE
jgi:hypothetical protein